MDILMYNDLNVTTRVKKQFDKVVEYLKFGDFKSADVKKMVSSNFYRAKLDDTNRLLFQIGQYGDKKYILLLEVILNHEYEKSRFLRGYGRIGEDKFSPIVHSGMEEEIIQLSYVNEKTKKFNILDKVISFDDIQKEIEKYPMPVIIIGSAGSGKTALTLEKMKSLTGKILYVTLSPYLVENAKNLYYSYNYDNEKQEIDFLSFNELLQTIEVVDGKEIEFKSFEQWIWKYKEGYKIKDNYKLFEEFKGVISGTATKNPYLTKEDYQNLGVKQSIFPVEEREKNYGLFLKYIEYLKENKLFDSNIVAFEHTQKAMKVYDSVVVDEVQDITSVQLRLIFSCLHNKSHFMLCGDSNQIVHPNFFSWSKVKTLFYHEEIKSDIIQILATNYRNTPEVTQIANKLLLVKNARFGSIDKESTYLVESNSKHQGEVSFYENTPKIKAEFNNKTRNSSKFAVIVLRNEDKAKAKQFFQTPLLFSVHEAKGLEYENVLLFDIISGNDKEFRDISDDVYPDDLQVDEMKYARTKDKTDKSLDEYKFYINALYVAITRAVKNLYVIETQKKHALLKLLDLVNFQQNVSIQNQSSTHEEWLEEARKLELQGKTEQADAIRSDILKVKNVPWEVILRSDLSELKAAALNPEYFNKKAKDKLFLHAIIYEERDLFPKLAELKYRPAEDWVKKGGELMRKHLTEYIHDQIKPVEQKTKQYGVDYRYEFNMTPLMVASLFGSVKILDFLIEKGANTLLKDNYGRSFFNFMLLKLYTDKDYGCMMLNKYYKHVKGQSIKLKIDNKLVKIEHHQGEYFILNYMISTYKNKIDTIISTMNPRFNYAFIKYQTSDFLSFYDYLSEEVLPEYRKKRSYISGILSKNEVLRDTPNNKKLFLRFDRGEYILNPAISLLIDDKWCNILDFFKVDEISKTLTYESFIEYQLNFMMHFREEIENKTVNLDSYRKFELEYQNKKFPNSKIE